MDQLISFFKNQLFLGSTFVFTESITYSGAFSRNRTRLPIRKSNSNWKQKTSKKNSRVKGVFKQAIKANLCYF